MPHLVLLGDSIFDNGAYTNGGPDIVSHVRGLLPPGWHATLLAVDGATTDRVGDQLDRVPRDATHLVLSVGGNNALLYLSFLKMSVSSLEQAVQALAEIAAEFEACYRPAVVACLRAGVPLAVCTIYNGCFEDPSFQRIASTVLMLFNDVIIRVASEHALPVIDLRAVCANPEDYANAIEPSSVGAEKIARVIVSLVRGGDATGMVTRMSVR